MRIIIEFIPQGQQRYNTVGDWVWEEEGLHVYVSILSNVFRSFLIGFHECFEAMWALRNGVSQAVIDDFDMEYEATRKPGDDTEPGDSWTSPYRVGHQRATILERIACDWLGEDWDSYEEEVNGFLDVP